jgi:predicted TIM-barrel fold metal-dependent hydrolase
VPLDKDELLRAMDEAGIDRAVLVPPTFAGYSNDLVVEAAERHPDRFAVMASVALDGSNGSESLSRLCDRPGVVGIRLVFKRGLGHQVLHDGTTDWLWAQAEKIGLPVMVFPPERLGEIAEIAKQHPDLHLAIDHLGLSPGLLDGDIDPVIDEVLTLARFPNVAVKASCLPSYVTEKYPFRSLHDRIRRVIGEFGCKRVFWGSDLTRLPCSYRELVTLFTEELDPLSREELEWIMGRGVSEWLGWRGGN